MPRILIIDDDPIMVDVVQLALQQQGFETLFAYDALGALNITKSIIPDLMLLDINMPDVDGLTLLESMGEIEGMRDVPIVMLTASRQEKTVKAAIESGAVYYIVKPIIPEDLVRRVRQILSLSEPSGVVWPGSVKQPRIKKQQLGENNEAKPVPVLFASPYEANHFNAHALEKRYSIDHADTGAAALQAIEEKPYPLLFVDCDLPDMDGYMLAHKIRQADKEKNRYHIIIGLGTQPRSDQKKWLAAGMNDYLAKPISITTLHRTLIKYDAEMKEQYTK